MLSMSNIGSVGQAASYYAEDNYYSQDENQAQSEWQGRGAEILGLSGQVATEDFTAILSGELGEQQLGRYVGTNDKGEIEREHRPGYDITLSAPKSVSILAEVGERRDVRAAHEAAVSQVLSYIEKNLVGARVTANHVTQFEQTDNVVAARFSHTTSRDLDPQTHTHLVIANATQTQDGQWRSLSNELLYKHQHLLGSIYDSELAANLREQGYRLETNPEGRWEVAGISKEQILEFSKRTQAIDQRLESLGLTRATATAEERETAALHTRSSKQEVDHGVLREEWKERAKTVGIDFNRIEEERAKGAQSPTTPSMTNDKSNAAVEFAIKHLTERESVVDKTEIMQTALKHAVKDSPWASVRLEHIQNSISDQVSKEQLIQIEPRTFTTPAAIANEQAMLAHVESGKNAVAPILSDEKVAQALVAFEEQKSRELGGDFKLTSGQADAATLTLTTTDRFIALQGYPGVGKTTMFSLVREQAEAAGFVVRGMATGAEAAATLQQASGIETSTTARFLIEEKNRQANDSKPTELTITGAVDLEGKDIRILKVQVPKDPNAMIRKELWVVDESSFAGQKEVNAIMDLAVKAGARVAFSGDRLQLNGVDAGKPFEVMQKNGISMTEMTQMNRQINEDLKNAAAAVVEKNNAKAFEILSNRILEIPNKDKLLDRIVHDVLQKSPSERAKSLVIVPLNKQRNEINNRVRGSLQTNGEISKTERKQNVLVASGFTEAQTKSAAYYTPDNVIRFGREYQSLGVERNSYATVQSTDIASNTVNLRDENGRSFAWNPAKNSNVEVYNQETRQIAVGDELRFTRNNKDLGVNNGTLAKVVSVSEATLIVATKDGKLELNSSEAQHAHLEYAYSMTVYASQGKTAHDANILITEDSGRAMAERAFLVSATRATTEMTIYTDSRDKAVDIITRVNDKTSALESLRDASDGDANRLVSPTNGNGSGGRSQGVEL